jgi:hypothetical protein
VGLDTIISGICRNVGCGCGVRAKYPWDARTGGSIGRTRHRGDRIKRHVPAEPQDDNKSLE